MAKRSWTSIFTKSMTRSLATLQRSALRSALPATRRALKAVTPKVALVKPVARGRTRVKAPGTPAAVKAGQWLLGVAIGPSGARRFRLYRPSGIRAGERVPLLVMLHGCGQDAKGFADSTRMNRIAAREGFLVLYPEQERLANAQGCWNWFDTKSGRAWGEVALIMAAIDQVCTLYPADRERVAVAGLSAGASMAALLVTRHPARFRALVMHSGVPPGSAHSTLSAFGAMRGRRPAGVLPAAPMTPTVDLPPLLVIHGGRDAVVAPGNGDTAARLWAEAAGASAVAARTVQRGKRHPMTVTDFRLRGRTVVTQIGIAGLAHAWSGGAASEPYGDAKGPDASRMVWAFAARQFKS
ncbi:MAG: PHB depolymerase family esterase [Pseudomonadota bacterium]